MLQSSIFSALTVKLFNRRRFRMSRRLSEGKTVFLKKKQSAMKLVRAPLSFTPRFSTM